MTVAHHSFEPVLWSRSITPVLYLPDFSLQEPAPVERWSGVRDATRHGHICPQIAFYPETAETFQHEDCLSLNIYSPHEVSPQRSSGQTL